MTPYKYHVNVVLTHYGFPNTFNPGPLRLDKDLGIPAEDWPNYPDNELADLVENRLNEVGATSEQRESTETVLTQYFLWKYKEEDEEHFGEEDDTEKDGFFDGRNRYVSIESSIATLSGVRGASRKPDILRGMAANKFAIMAAAPGTGKSMMGLIMAAAVSSGQSILGFQPNDEDGLNSLFISLEEDSDEILLRWQAIKQVHDIDTNDRLHIAGENNVQWHTTGGIDEFITGGIYDLAELISAVNAKFVVLDPLAQWRLGAEDNATFSLFSSAIKQICVDCDTTVMVIHHVRKPPPGFKAESHNADSIRGASDLRGAARTILLLDYETKIAPNVISCSFDKVQYGQSKYRLPPMQFTNEIVETDIGNYETGVLVEYTPPHELPMPVYMVDEYRDILVSLYETERYYRTDVRSPQWLGVGIADAQGIDIGTGRKAAERSKDQNEAIQSMKTDIAKLVRLDLIEPYQLEDHDTKNRNKRMVQVYARGHKL